MAVFCPEKLPKCHLSQLASRLQRLSADVLYHDEHHLVEAAGGDRVPVPGDRLPVSRPGPPGHQQQLPDQVQQQPRPPLLYLNHGASPL